MRHYTDDELDTMLGAMEKASAQFYANAVRIGCHPFIEFTGLMNEYIKLCYEARKQGVEFPLASEHSGKPLPAKVFHMNYIAEKMRCIFGPTLDAHPEAKEAFIRSMGLRDDD